METASFCQREDCVLEIARLESLGGTSSRGNLPRLAAAPLFFSRSNSPAHISVRMATILTEGFAPGRGDRIERSLLPVACAVAADCRIYDR